MPNIDEAIEALLAYRQADMEGTMVLTSRQAIHEVADELMRLRAVAATTSDRGNYEDRHPQDMVMVRHPLSEIKEWDEALAVLGIQDSDQTPADAIRELNAEIERLRDAARSSAGRATSPIGQADVQMLVNLADSMGFGRTHDMLRRVIAACPYLTAPVLADALAPKDTSPTRECACMRGGYPLGNCVECDNPAARDAMAANRDLRKALEEAAQRLEARGHHYGASEARRVLRDV